MARQSRHHSSFSCSVLAVDDPKSHLLSKTIAGCYDDVVCKAENETLLRSGAHRPRHTVRIDAALLHVSHASAGCPRAYCGTQMWAVKKRMNRSRCRLGGACSTRTLFQISSMYSRLERSILVHSTATQPENLIWKAEFQPMHGHPSPSLSFLSPFLFPLSFPLPSFLLYPLSSPPLRSRSLKSSYGG